MHNKILPVSLVPPHVHKGTADNPSLVEDTQTWRELLARIINDYRERQRIASIARVAPYTLTRWAIGQSTPRPDNIIHLLKALPAYRQQLLALLAVDFPELRLQERISSFGNEELEDDVPP